MARKYVPKKPRKIARNRYLRWPDKPLEMATPLAWSEDGLPGEPVLGDFFRHHVPGFLTVFAWVHERELEKGANISKHEIAKSIYNVALAYRQGQGIEARISEQSKLNGDKKWPRLKTRTRGQPFRFGDYALIAEASQLLQRMKGHNARLGWGSWNAHKGKRQKSSVQLFVELILELIDPYRTTPLAARYYPIVKKRLGLTIPRVSGNKRHTTRI